MRKIMKSGDDPQITVIIPTIGVRETALKRAIASVVNQEGMRALPLIVLNGNRFSADVLEYLRCDPAIRLHKIEEPSVSQARYIGRTLVETEYFSFLDDDDELLPGALNIVKKNMEEDEKIDVLVGNGYDQIGKNRTDHFVHFNEYKNDPAMELMKENWLASSGGFYRTRNVSIDFFSDLPDYLEMTIIGMRLSQSLKIKFINEKLFLIHIGHDGQVSKSIEYIKKQPEIIKYLERSTKRKDLIRILREKRAAALHLCAMNSLESGDFYLSWKYHLKSLFVWPGIKYITSTRHLIKIR